jgi:hypothetical protein
MTYDELVNILLRAEPGDWRYNKERATYVNRHDLDIRVEMDPSRAEGEPYTEAWACRFPDPEAKRVHYNLYYRNSLVEQFSLVEVDGGKVALPLPRHHIGLVVSEKDYALARIVDRDERLADYLKRCDIRIVPGSPVGDWT